MILPQITIARAHWILGALFLAIIVEEYVPFVGRDGADYARLWRIVNDNNAGRYDGYQALTSRPIPVVALTLEEARE